MATKIVAVWYPLNTVRAGRREVMTVESDADIKKAFGLLLFDKAANNLLVNYGGKLYIIEATDRIKRIYTRRVTEYHPLSDMVKI
jgi:hypothetical protein